ncbi:hypothetical protein BD770DRAFT_395639 [Pilaira anomala]|nr:hypothetical protein BD770DRAFT_395639 [Pilaira anomala]
MGNNRVKKASVYISPQVKQLFISNIVFDDSLCGYLMVVFPKLDELELDLNYSFTSGSQPSNKVSKNTALRFLFYLTNISSASVNYLPVEGVEDLVTRFQDLYNGNKHISIRYKKSDCLRTTDPPYLTISAKQKIDILVNYTNYKRVHLPLFKTIEKSGRRIQSLSFIEGTIASMKRKIEMNIVNSGADFYHIIFYCSGLREIRVIRTILPGLRKYLRHAQKISLHDFILESGVIDDLFFSSLSSYIAYIDTLTIRTTTTSDDWCRSDRYMKKCIDMPETKLNNLFYFHPCDVYRIFLKLKITGDDTIGWFVSNKTRFESCIEEDYEASVHDEGSISLYICCADIRTFEFDCNRFNATFKV